MAKKIVQLENNDGDQIFPISATDIALPGTKVKTEFKTSGGDITAQTDTVLVTETITTPGDYAVIGSVDVQMGSSNRIDVHLYHNGSTSLAQQYTTPISNRAGLTLIGRLDNASEGDTVSLNVRCDNSATTDSRTQGLVLIKLPEGAPTYKGGALVVTLNVGGTYSGATEMEMFNAVRNGKPVVLRGPILDSGSALLLSMNTSVRSSWGSFLTNEGRTYRIKFNSDNTYSIIDMTTAESYSTSEEATGGTWVDGKVIYRKTVRFSLTATDHLDADVSTGISNGETLVDIRGRLTANATGLQYPIPFGEPGQWQVMVRSISSGLGTVKLKCNVGAVLNNVSGELTLFYTKTTV